MLEIKDLDFFYSPDRLILDRISFTIPKGEIVALIGCSGSGKTTLFRLITGILTPSRGKIRYECDKPTYMQQEDLLLPWRTVYGNLRLMSELGGNKIEISKSHINEMLNLVGLEGLVNAYPSELSGGQRQRVSLARALLQNHPLLLLDEPFGSLDVIIREQLYSLLTKICAQLKKTIILVTHDFRDALEIADRILILREGKIAADFKIPEVATQTQMTRQIRHYLLGKPSHSNVHWDEQTDKDLSRQEEYLRERVKLAQS